MLRFLAASPPANDIDLQIIFCGFEMAHVRLHNLFSLRAVFRKSRVDKCPTAPKNSIVRMDHICEFIHAAPARIVCFIFRISFLLCTLGLFS